MSDPEAGSGLRTIGGLLLGGVVVGAGVLLWTLPSMPGVVAAMNGIVGVLALWVAVLALGLAPVREDPALARVGLALGAGSVLHLFFAATGFPGFFGPDPSPAVVRAGWVGVSAGTPMALLLVVAAWSTLPGRGDSRIRATALATGGLVIGFGVVPGFLATRWPPPSGPVLPSPHEVLPGLLFALAFLILLRSRRWSRGIEWRGIMGLALLGALAYLGPRSFSTGIGDPGHLWAAGLLVLAVGIAAFGLTTGVLADARREPALRRSLMKARAEAAREARSRSESERRSGETERSLYGLLDEAQDLVQSIDSEGRFQYVNARWTKRVGYSIDELSDRTLLDLLHPSSKAAVRDAMRRVEKGDSLTDVPMTLEARDGSLVACSASLNARLVEGRPVAILSILRDRSSERKAEEELKHFQANLQAVFESTGDAIWSVDRQHRLITFNTAYALILEVITGRSPKVGDPLGALVSPDALSWFRSCYDRALAGTRFTAVREERVDGQVRTFDLYFNPIEGAKGGPSGVVVFSRDVTRRRKVEEALRRAKKDAEEASRTKSQFLANMSHELRTPLNSIIGFANILLKKHGESMEDRERGYMERILVNGKHLLTLINEILDLSKIEAGRMELQIESVDLRRLVRETVSQLESQVSGTKVDLRWEVEGDPAPFRTDLGKLKQVLINLVANALKFTEEGSVTLRVCTEADGRTPARIEVQDTGIGIPQDRLDAIFHAFQQADSGTARRFGGTGLGLTISRSLCTLMGYELEVESEVGEGSSFSIRLVPGDEGGESRLEALDAPPTARWSGGRPVEPAQVLEGRKVLVVDDEADSRDLLTHYLQDLGCRVITAADGVEGLEVARRESPDLITVDLMMPRMSGWELLRAIREDAVLRGTPVVVISIVAEEGGGQVLGAVDLLDKPVDRDELARILSRNLTEGSGRVLVVEDNPDARLLLTRYLREAGLQVDGVSNGKDALEHLSRHPVDLVILDLMMPEMDGFTLLGRMRESKELTRIPVVVLTAKDLAAEEARLLDEHGVRVIQKGAEVEGHLRSVLDRMFEVGGGG
ncbi:MAG: response regulator [Gemmatimonadales bacterium]|nr:MAG: response regulator [Gemmatimonadales bacterium]